MIDLPTEKKYYGENGKEKAAMWTNHLNKCIDHQQEWCDVVFYGASNIARRDEDKWSSCFGRKVLNFAYGGNRIEHLLYRIQGGCIPKYAQLVIVHIGTSNVESHSVEKITQGIYPVCTVINAYRGDVDILVTGILPGKGRPVKKVKMISHHRLHDIFMDLRADRVRATFKKPNIDE